jgi:hypothetical protein
MALGVVPLRTKGKAHLHDSLGVVLPALLLLGACTSGKRTTSDPLPLPPEGAQEVETLPTLSGVQVRFEIAAPYRSMLAIDHYAKWAQSHGWKPVPQEVEDWSRGSWDAFGPPWEQTDQYFVHWKSPDGKESLRIMAFHRSDKTKQSLVVQRVPFELLR